MFGKRSTGQPSEASRGFPARLTLLTVPWRPICLQPPPLLRGIDCWSTGMKLSMVRWVLAADSRGAGWLALRKAFYPVD